MAVGGGLGHILGGSMVDVAAQRQLPALPWLVFGGVGLLSAVGLWLFYEWRSARPSRALAHAPASGD